MTGAINVSGAPTRWLEHGGGADMHSGSSAPSWGFVDGLNNDHLRITDPAADETSLTVRRNKGGVFAVRRVKHAVVAPAGSDMLYMDP